MGLYLMQMDMFQFLGRNSGRSDQIGPHQRKGTVEFQFLGRNSGRSDLPCLASSVPPCLVFQFLGRNSGRSDSLGGVIMNLMGDSFNSSVGILVVRTCEMDR